MKAKGVVIEVMVDGGINDKTARDCIDAGARTLVAGTFLFHHPVSLKQAIQDLLPPKVENNVKD